MDIVFEDNHLLVINKPVGWVVQGAQAGQHSLLEHAKNYVKQKYQKPGNVYLGVVSRLDSPVSGLVPLAKTSKAAARLSEQIRTRSIKKIYWTLVAGQPSQTHMRLEHWLLRQESDTVTRVVSPTTPNAQQAVLEYKVLKKSANQLSATNESTMTWLEIELITGRKHQIRAQLAAIDCPIVGDAKYGARNRFAHGIALHCRRLVFQHPTKQETLDLTGSAPSHWPFWTRT